MIAIKIKSGTDVPDVYCIFKFSVWSSIILEILNNYLVTVVSEAFKYALNTVLMWINLYLLPTPYIM